MGAGRNVAEWEEGGGVLMLDATDPGLGESSQLRSVERGGRVLVDGADGVGRGINVLVWEAMHGVVDEAGSVLILPSSMALSLGAA